jgi:hypothetical protein
MASVSSDININVKANVRGATAQINSAGDAVRNLGRQAKIANDNVNLFSVRLNGAGGANKFLRSGLQQTGYQVGDFAVQVANGTSAMQAFGQQAPQLLQIFGPVGAIAGAAVAIFAAFAVVIEKAGGKAKGLSDALGVMKEPLQAVMESLSGLKDVAKDTFQFLLNSIDTMIISVGLLAAKFAITKVAAIAFGATMATSGTLTQTFALQAALAGRSLTVLEKSAITANIAMTAFGVRLRVLSLIFRGFLPIAIIMALAAIIEKFLVLRQNLGSFGAALGAISDLMRAVFNSIGTQVALISESVKRAALGMRLAYVTQFNEIAKAAKEILPEVALNFVGLTVDDKALKDIQTLIKESEARTEALLEAPGVGDAWEKFAKNFDSKDVELDGFGNGKGKNKPEDMGGLKSGGVPIPQASPMTKDYMAKLAELNLQIDQITEKQRLMDQLGLSESVAEQAAQMTVGFKQTDEQVAELVEKLKLLEELKKPVESFAEAIKDVGKTIKSEFSSAFESVMNGTKSVGEAFRDMILKITMSLADRAMNSAFDDLFSKMAKTSGTSGGFADLFSKGVSYLGGLFGGGTTSEVPGLADGGYASATKPHLIGERGPEVFIPSASGRVVSNSDLGGMGGQVNQTFNITTGVQQTVRAEIQSLMPQIAAASTKAVLEARRRGGSFAGAFA